MILSSCTRRRRLQSKRCTIAIYCATWNAQHITDIWSCSHEPLSHQNLHIMQQRPEWLGKVMIALIKTLTRSVKTNVQLASPKLPSSVKNDSYKWGCMNTHVGIVTWGLDTVATCWNYSKSFCMARFLPYQQWKNFTNTNFGIVEFPLFIRLHTGF